MHSRLVQLFLNIKNGDLISEHGHRFVHQGISGKPGKQLLQEFIFTPRRPVPLQCPYHFNWERLTFEVREFNVNEARFPKNSDFMEVVIGLIRFDFESCSYERILAAPVTIARDFEGDAFEVCCHEIPGGAGILFAVVSVAFYQKVNEERRLTDDPGSFGTAIVSVWDDEVLSMTGF